MFRTPTVRWVLFITIFLQLSQQLSGINAVFYYSTVILQSAGFNKQAAEYANLGLGGANIFVTVLSIFLMDRLGRRLLHLIGIGGMFITSIVLFISLMIPSTAVWNKTSLIATFLFVAFFAVGPGSIPWLITSELFNQAYRVPASSIAVLVNWSANFAVGLGFKPLFTVNEDLQYPPESLICTSRVCLINIHFFCSLAPYSPSFSSHFSSCQKQKQKQLMKSIQK